MNIMLSTIISELTVHDNSISLYTFLILHLLILLFSIEGCTFVIIYQSIFYTNGLYTQFITYSGTWNRTSDVSE